MTYTREGDIRYTVVLSEADQIKLDALRGRESRSHATRRAIRLQYALRGMTTGSKLLLTNPDGTQERVLLLP